MRWRRKQPASAAPGDPESEATLQEPLFRNEPAPRDLPTVEGPPAAGGAKLPPAIGGLGSQGARAAESGPVPQQRSIVEVAPITPVNPTEFLRMFESVGGSVTEVGADTIRGAETTHYVVVFDMEHLLRVADPGQLEDLENLGPLPFDELPMDIWVSSDGLVHRFEIMLDASLADVPEGEGFDRLVMRFDLFDHGLPVDIVAPPTGEVTAGGDLGGIFGARDSHMSIAVSKRAARHRRR